MKATITTANRLHGRYAAQTEEGDYIAFELTDSTYLAAGDLIAGVLHGHAGETFTRLESGEQFSVFVEMIGTTRMAATAWANR